MTLIGKYEVVRQTGETPLGAIYEAFDPVMRRTVSIQAPQDLDAETEHAKRATSQVALQRGGECLGRLSHPNIRNIIATEEADGTLYLVLEHVDALPVWNRVPADGLPPNEAVSLLKMAAAALDHAHSKGVTHPGLGPSHLLVDSAGLLKVAGFEMSGFESFDAESLTSGEAELLLSSVAYRAPEVLLGETFDGRSDQFSLAAIAFKLLVGRRESDSDSPIVAMAAIVSCNRFDASLLDSRFPSGVRRVIDKALAFEGAERYQSCSAFVDALETATLRKSASMTRLATPEESALITPQALSTITNRRNSEYVERPSPPAASKGRSKARIFFIAALATVLVIAGVFVLLLRQSSIPSARGTNPSATSTSTSSPVSGDTDQQIRNVLEKRKQLSPSQSQNQPSAPSAPEGAAVSPTKPKARKKTTKSPPPESKLQGPEVKIPQ